MLQPTERPPISFRAAIGRFHQAWAGAGHNGKAKSGDARAHLTGELIFRCVGFDPSRAKNGHARADKMKHPETAQKIRHDSKESKELLETRMRTLEHDLVCALGWRGRRRLIAHRHG